MFLIGTFAQPLSHAAGFMKYLATAPSMIRRPQRKLLDLVRSSIGSSGMPYAYTGEVNLAFLRDGGDGDEYVAGVKLAAERNWFEIDRSGTRIRLLPDGAE